ncbi:hypothetical protein TAL182_PC00471 (plasmid) [Rhizobium sp. TAL182]|nr:hypothetical protein TAL182_PC00471 [Rhizobium sp. TAL182]
MGVNPCSTVACRERSLRPGASQGGRGAGGVTDPWALRLRATAYYLPPQRKATARGTKRRIRAHYRAEGHQQFTRFQSESAATKIDGKLDGGYADGGALTERRVSTVPSPPNFGAVDPVQDVHSEPYSVCRACDSVMCGLARLGALGQPLNNIQNSFLMLFAPSALARILNLFVARR